MGTELSQLITLSLYQNESTASKEYGSIMAELDELLQDLSMYYGGSTPPSNGRDWPEDEAMDGERRAGGVLLPDCSDRGSCGDKLRITC